MITLCVPTMNRSPFIARLLSYYAKMRSLHWIFLGDASNAEHAQANRRLVEAYRGTLNIVYHHDPSASACACLEALSHRVETSFVAFLGDDDFLTVRSLQACEEFLSAQPACGAVHGQAVMFQTEDNSPHGPIGNVKAYPQAILNEETGAGRLREFFGRSLYTLLYSVHRVETWRAMFTGVSEMPGMRNRNIFKDELIAVSVSAIRGKVAALPILSLVHQTHDTSYRFPHVFDWLTNPAWSASYQRFQSRLIEELGRQDDMAPGEAEAVVRDVFWPFIAGQVTRAWRDGLRSPRKRSWLRQWAKRIPGARSGWGAMRAQADRLRDELSLPSLLSAPSPYYADFLPVYQMVTSPPQQQGAERLVTPVQDQEVGMVSEATQG